jgi:tRNA modification GTPase
LCEKSPVVQKGTEAKFCVLTAEGQGAVAVVRVWGAGAIDLVGRVFRPDGAVPVTRKRPGALRLGRVGAGLGDEVVGVVLETATPAIELQCHGGHAAVSLVLEALELAGAERHDRWEISGLDFPGGDELAAQALDDISKAPTVRTAEILLDQAQGALREELTRLAELVPKDPLMARAGLDALIERGGLGLRLLSGWKVVIAGRPNVGKSRLLNALCGFQRAIVDNAPGTTRDVVAFRTALEGWPVELADTAGLRTTADAIEHLGVKRSSQELATADLVVIVLDRSEPLQPIDRQLIAPTARALVVANKSDLPAYWQVHDAGLGVDAVVTISAERGHGLNELIAAISKRLVSNPPPPGQAVPFRRVQLKVLEKAHDDLSAARTTTAQEGLMTLISSTRREIEADSGAISRGLT